MAVPQAVAHTPIVVGPGLSPLEGARIDVRIDDLLAEFTLTQSFRNVSRDDIEAVFTFPVPIDAVFLGLNATLGERELEGRIVEKQQARRTYERAISEGDSAVLVERTENGLLTTNIGNLKPGETIALRLRFAQWLSFNGHAVTFRMPTTIAPRYGKPAMDEREAPVTDLLAQYRLAARIQVTGLLTQAELHSPSHLVVIEREEGALSLTLKSAWMDRDFLLDAEFGEVERCSAMADRDGEGHIVSVAVAADFTGEDAPLDVVLVVDCSGSMRGTSINEARKAMKGILHGLGEQDRIDLVRYGSSHHSAFGRLRELSRETRSQLEEHITATDADLGGTETVAALESAAATIVRDSKGSERSRILFLVTDGAIESPNIARLEATCRKHGIRIFVVGVGLANGEAAVQTFAQSTGGAAEIVHPNQDMAAKVVRHFHRVRKPAGTITHIDWPTAPNWTHVPEYFHSGDTIRVFARFDQPVSGEVAVHWQSREAGQACTPIRIATPTDEPISTLARMAASIAFDRTPERPAQVDLALRYQLLTHVSSAILVAPRSDADKAGDQPTTVRVPQMMAAGWSGARDEEFCGISYCRSVQFSQPAAEYLGLPALLRRSAERTPKPVSKPPTTLEWRQTDVDAMLSWIDAELAHLLAQGGDIEAGVEALLLRLKRANSPHRRMLAAIASRCAKDDAAGLLGALLHFKSLGRDESTPVLDLFISRLRALGWTIIAPPPAMFEDVQVA